MKLYKISDLKLLEEITVVASNREDAANFFMASLIMGLGKMPEVEFSTCRWRPKTLTADSKLAVLMQGQRRGFAWPNDKGSWDFSDPLSDSFRLRE